jgi:tetratricopeptide (TPR) repeat protein
MESKDTAPPSDGGAVIRPPARLRNAADALALAEREFASGCTKVVIDLLEHAVALDRRNTAARVMLALAYARTRCLERAFKHLEEVLAVDPDGFSPRCALGELYLRLGDPEQARQHLDRALTRASNAAERARVISLIRQNCSRGARLAKVKCRRTMRVPGGTRGKRMQ